jgi:hypothetical protein
MTILTKESVAAISDLIENKLAIMTVDDRDDLREMVSLKRALLELRGNNDPIEAGVLRNFNDIPRRGRRRKIGDMNVGELIGETA